MIRLARPLIKVCGLTRPEDVQACLDLEVDLLGFVFHAASPRCVSPGLPAGIGDVAAFKVGVFTTQSVDEALAILAEGRLDLAQLQGAQDEAFCEALGPERVIKVLWPESYASEADFLADVARFSGCCRFLLLDAGRSGGGHGRRMDPARFARLPRGVEWFLAGGLSPANLAASLDACDPCGVDLNSGVESAQGRKDADKIARAVEIVRARRLERDCSPLRRT